MANTETAAADVLDYFAANLANAVPTGVQVVDGDPRIWTAEGYIALTGWEYSQTPATMGGRFQLEESVAISAVIRTAQGDTDQSAVRRSAINIFNAFQDFIRSDPTLGGLVRQSWIERGQAEQGITGKAGVGCQIEVSVTFDARIT